jgi:pyruvyltransferase
MKELNLIMYRDNRGDGNGNFGDELSEIILKFLFKKYLISDVEIKLNKSKDNNIVFIGSLIIWANNNYNNINVLGSGIRTEKDNINTKTKMKIYSVRGPLTKKYLEKFNYHVNNILGDPALLLPKFYKPNNISLCKNKIGVVGHLTNFHNYKNIPDNYIMINPTWKWEKVVDYIYSCDIVLSSSLHGLIIADAYDIPNIWLDEYPLNEGHFKFKDYFLSQDRNYEYIKNIFEYEKVVPNKKGNIIDLDKIEYAFRNMCSDLNLIDNYIINNTNYYLAYKQHFKKKGGNLICSSNTFLKKSIKHSIKLDDHMKMRFKIGSEVNIISDFSDNYWMISLQKSINRCFYGFWDSNEKISNIQLTQIQLWAKSIIFFHKNANIFLYTKKKVIPEGIININNLTIIYMDNFDELFKDTPLVNYKIPNNISKPELSDIIRLVLLYKNGGTWLDIDDIVVREFPQEKNILGAFLWKNNKKNASYWGSAFNLVDGSLISHKYKEYGFHIQNDPMVNWEKGNKFLYIWMKNIIKNKSADWGQKIPTEIIRLNKNIINECNITLLPQHHLLLHPAFGSNKQFGYPNSKGPMFPPYDLRITGKVNYDDMITKEEFWEVVKQTLEKHDYCCVKNSKNTGIKQCNEGKDKRWFIGYLCDLNNINKIMDRLNNYGSNNRRNIMIVAHPDDELFFGWKELLKDNNWFIICLTHGDDNLRSDKFKKVMNILNLDYIMYSFPDYYNTGSLKWNNDVMTNITKLINKELKNINYHKIVTHNPHGEYGHYHHRVTSKIVTKLLQDRNEEYKLYYFGFNHNFYQELPKIYDTCLEVYFTKQQQNNDKSIQGHKQLSKISTIIRSKDYIDNTHYNKKFYTNEFLMTEIIKYNT